MTVTDLNNEEEFNQFLEDEHSQQKNVAVLFYLESDANCDAIKEKFNEIANKNDEVAFAQVDVENAEYKDPDDRVDVITMVLYVEGGKVTV